MTVNENRSSPGKPRRRAPSILAAAAALLVSLAPAAACAEVPSDRAGDAVEVERQTYLMGTLLTARVVASDRDAAFAAIEAAFDEVARMEALLSTWDSTTALSRLNRAPVGVATPVSSELLSLLARADRLADSTGRAFEPAVGPLIDTWDIRGEGRRPTADEIVRARAAVRAGFDLDTGAGTATRRDPAAWIDTGGFGKGVALAAAVRALRNAGVERAFLDFGGQTITLGERPGGGPWRIGVAHPARRNEPVTELRVGPGLSVATSGGSERPGHLLDPRSGTALPSWGSVTVVSPDPVVADVLSTALFVLGPEAGLAWVRQRPDVGALFLEDAPGGLRADWNPAMERWLDPSSIDEPSPTSENP